MTELEDAIRREEERHKCPRCDTIMKLDEVRGYLCPRCDHKRGD